MKLDRKKVFEICNTFLSSADLDTITEKKVRRQVEEELGLEDMILDSNPYKSIVKEIVNEILNDLQQKSDSSCSTPQVSRQKKTASRVKTTTKSTSINKKPSKTEVKSKNSSKGLEEDEDFPNSKSLNSKARSKVSKQELSPTSKTQAEKTQNTISKTYGESSGSKPTNREEKSKTMKDTSKINDNKSSSGLRLAKSNVTNKLTKRTGRSNKSKIAELNKEISSEEESESASSIKSAEANNKEKQKPNVSRSRVKRKINVSSDTDDNKSNAKSDSVPSKLSDLEESASPSPKRSKQIKIGASSDDEEPSSRMCDKKKVDEEERSYQKIEPIEVRGAIMALENKFLAQDSDMIGSKNDDCVESDNTIKDDDREVSGRISESEGDAHTFQDNSESVGEAKQELNSLKVESMSPKGALNFKDEDDYDPSSLENDKPRNKKQKIEKTKSVNNKTEKGPTKSTETNEKNEKRIKTLKSFINKCGVRKNWSRELADCGTDSSKIKKLKKILEDLGIEGRPTLEKCKKVKKSRELEAELKAMDVDNIISDDVKETRKARASRGIFNPVGRRVSRISQSSPEYDDSSSKGVQSDSE
ncbi:hypothetical protein RclHR1_07520003 [Rhizophagus clarus]|uniref:DEK-C domain-containing protein n=1 Tax=Rhizophagus clarus TaxID=94130 RepID=A0A2Z6SLL4_9GLOM|nr:hypothetical protein RclHR1_07520003 [Rhizophagus clarus]